MVHRFVVTPWRDADELLELRRWLYWKPGSGEADRKRSGVEKIIAWRVKWREIPLMLESTADLVDAVLQDENAELEASALRLVYGTAITRFATGISDTSTELRRSRPSWLPSHLNATFLDFPAHILETRHSIVHRHFPSLAELKRTAQESLDWLWEWYWSHLNHALRKKDENPEGGKEAMEGMEGRGALQAMLKSYVRDRKIEIKTNKRPKGSKMQSRAADKAATSYTEISGHGTAGQNILIDLLIDEKAILPSDKKLGSTMSGAFLIWTPLLSQLSLSIPTFLELFTGRMCKVLNAPTQVMMSIEDDPVREAMYEWLLHISTAEEWRTVRERSSKTWESSFVDQMLETCFSEPSYWHLRLAESILKDEELEGRELWLALLRAAKDEEMEVDVLETRLHLVEDVTEGIEYVQDVEVEKLHSTRPVIKNNGPRKVIGLWRPQPIGILPVGWEDDE